MLGRDCDFTHIADVSALGQFAHLDEDPLFPGGQHQADHEVFFAGEPFDFLVVGQGGAERLVAEHGPPAL